MNAIPVPYEHDQRDRECQRTGSNPSRAYYPGSGKTGGYAAAYGTRGMSEAGARMAVSRLRERFRELLQEEVLRTVATGQDVNDEIRLLFKALSVK